MLGKRGTFGSVLTELAPSYENLMAMSADFGRSSGLARYSELFPEKYLNVGIAEQNLIGVSSGLASEGYNVFATSFASFITTRSYEMVKIHCGYMQHNIKVVGLAAGFGVQLQGNTHYGLDDICLMRSIPNLTIISPADSTEVVKATEALLDFKGPVYLRLCGEANDPMVYSADYEFEIGKAITLQEGTDVTIVATGTMVYQSLQAAKKLAGLGVECTVINMHTINPIDNVTINKYCHDCKLVVTVEEGFISGGLGAAVLEEMAASSKPMTKVLNIGLTQFPHPGSYKYLLAQTGLDAEHIAEKIIAKLAT
jgi:transketolase